MVCRGNVLYLLDFGQFVDSFLMVSLKMNAQTLNFLNIYPRFIALLMTNYNVAYNVIIFLGGTRIFGFSFYREGIKKTQQVEVS